MSTRWLETIAEQLREGARESVTSTFGSTPINSIEPVVGGASGAVAYRIETGGRFYVLRMETRRSPLRNPNQYACMRIAADAGIAPAVRYADGDAGVAILDFVHSRPLNEYSGGPPALAAALGKLAAKLQATPPFPPLGDYRVFLDRMLGYMQAACASGLLDQHAEVFGRIREAYPWNVTSHVSSHNDPNPRNILFDGQRLWLIDWETSYRNDPLTDIAILADNHAATPELEEFLLEGWLGVPADRAVRARLPLMRRLTRLYYAGLFFVSAGKGPAPVAELAAPTVEEFTSLIASGQLKQTSNETKIVLAKMLLAGFLAGADGSDFKNALSEVRSG